MVSGRSFCGDRLAGYIVRAMMYTYTIIAAFSSLQSQKGFDPRTNYLLVSFDTAPPPDTFAKLIHTTDEPALSELRPTAI